MSMALDSVTFGAGMCAQLRYRRDDGGWHRDIREPGADIGDLPKDVQAKIAEAWTPAVIATRAAFVAEINKPPPPPEADDRIAAIEARLAQVELRADRIEADVISEQAVKA